jgi:hypothetical protein
VARIGLGRSCAKSTSINMAKRRHNNARDSVTISRLNWIIWDGRPITKTNKEDKPLKAKKGVLSDMAICALCNYGLNFDVY